MASIFITGDRMFSPIYVPLVFTEMLRASVNGDIVSTGDQEGIEGIVRLIADEVGMSIDVLPAQRGADGKVDHAVRAQMLNHPSSGVTSIVAVHADPMASSVTKALMEYAENKVRLVSPLDLLG